jgi:hypothetical protein
MPANVGKTDAAIRWALAAALFAGALVFSDSRLPTLLAALAALILAGTALTRVCPLWYLLHVNTCRGRIRQPPRQPENRTP